MHKKTFLFIQNILRMLTAKKDQRHPPRSFFKSFAYSSFFGMFLIMVVSLILLNSEFEISSPGADTGFFLGGGALVFLLYFNTSILLNTSCIRKPQVISRGRGGWPAHPSTLPLDPPLQPAVSLVLSGIIVLPKLLLSVERKEWVGVFPCISCNVMYTERYGF